MRTSPRTTMFAMLGATLALGGCGEVMFKRGAGPGDMAGAQQACRERSGGAQDAYATCMQAAGFVYAKDGGEGVLSGVLKPAAPASATPTAAPATAADAPASAPAMGCCMHGTATVVPSGRAGETVGGQPPQAPAPPADPMAPVAVSSWWKLGGSAGALAAAEDACVGTLGEAHRPDANSTRVTAAMLACLKAGGWYAVGR